MITKKKPGKNQSASLKKPKAVAKKTHPKQLKGLVVSAKSKKTVAVKVITIKAHPIYKKRYRSAKKYLAHNPDNKFKKGDKVIIQETKPISKRKSWIVKDFVK